LSWPDFLPDFRIASCIVVDGEQVDEGDLSFFDYSVSGLFKITRVGSTISVFYDIGAGWVLLTTAPNAFTCPVIFSIYAQTGDIGWSYVDSDWIEIDGMGSVQGPDLVGEFGQVKLRAPVNPGDTIRTQIIVSNIGEVATAFKQVIDIEVCLRPCDAIDDTQDICVMTLTNRSVSNLRPGRSKKFNARVTLPADLEGGEYRLVAKVDSLNSVVELNEDNNTAVTTECFEIMGE